MAREYAPIRLAIWSDDDFRALSPRAQHLYFVLLTSPSLSYAGVADWRPGRIAANAAGWTAAGVQLAADELVRGLFIVIDAESEEVLIRSFIKHDGLLKNPNVAVSMALAFAGIASNVLRGVIVHELKRLHDNQPGLKGWSKVDSLLDRKSVDPASYPFGYPSGEGVDSPSSEGVRYPLAEGVHQGVGYPLDQPFGEEVDQPQMEGVDQGFPSLPAPAPAPSSSSYRGAVTGERHYATPHDPNDPPAHHCPIHPGGTSENCGPCGDARRSWVAWNLENDKRAAAVERARVERVSAERRQAAEDRANRIAACAMCDDDGQLHDPTGDGISLCDHRPARKTRPSLREQFEAHKREQAPPPEVEPPDESDEDAPPEAEEHHDVA